MRGKYLLLLFFVLVPYVVRGACPEYDNDQDRCIRQEGCQYKPEIDGIVTSKCATCENNRYCPNNAICSDGFASSDGSCPCPEQFPSSMEGTTSIHNCYAPCAQGSDNYDQVENCGFPFGADDDGYENTHIFCVDQSGYAMVSNDLYHFELIDPETVGCYLNVRPCNLFGAQNRDSEPLDSENLINAATWDNDGGHYDVRDCRYKTTNETLHNCIATIYYHPYNMQYVATAQDSIKFYTGDGNSGDVSNQDYYCTVCKDGPYYPVLVTNIATCADPNNFESSGTTYYQACKCEQIPRGYYYSANTQWIYASQVGQPNSYYTACPAGKTTQNNIGGTSSDDCTYTPDTKFCDANGCFHITDAPGDWNWSY